MPQSLRKIVQKVFGKGTFEDVVKYMALVMGDFTRQLNAPEGDKCDRDGVLAYFVECFDKAYFWDEETVPK